MLTKDQIWNSRNSARTVDLIYELNNFDPKTALFTVGNTPAEGYIDLRKLYVNYCIDDPSEVDFVDVVFGDWHYWTIFCKTKTFIPFLERWRAEVSVRRKQKQFKVVVNEAATGKSAFTAAKYLIEEPWAGQGVSMAEKRKIKKRNQAETEEAFHSDSIQSDIARLREEGILQ